MQLSRKQTLKNQGFTLIELLVVISIIGFLSTLIMVTTTTLRLKARDSVRLQNLKQIQTAVNLYYAQNGIYPKTYEPGNAVQSFYYCDFAWGLPDHQTDYVPGISAYIANLPSDPALDCDGIAHSWSYTSDGVQYKLVTHPEGNNAPFFIDPAIDGGVDPCNIDGEIQYHIAVWYPPDSPLRCLDI